MSEKDKYVVLTKHVYQGDGLSSEINYITTNRKKAEKNYVNAKDFAIESGTVVYLLKAIRSSEVLDE